MSYEVNEEKALQVELSVKPSNDEVEINKEKAAEVVITVK